MMELRDTIKELQKDTKWLRRNSIILTIEVALLVCLVLLLIFGGK
uniref:Uncharacterized protein n=1 Tax=viral metagenome TaxID=1070528 RepID=A0A6H2A3D4_9ZZZZ